MKCKSCGHDIEVIGVDRDIVQEVMLKDPCCAEPDYTMPAEEDMFTYLNVLRNGGVYNMFGARPHLMLEFNLSRTDAVKVLGEWMRHLGT